MTLAAPVLQRLRRAQGCVRAARLRRPDRAHVRPAGRSRRGLGAVQAGRRPRSPAAGRGAGHRAGAMAHRARADRGVLRRRDGARRAPHRVRRRRPQAVDLFVPGRRCRRVRPARTGCCASGWTRRASPGATRRWTCRSAPRGRCWNWWIGCSPTRPPRPAWWMPGDTLTHYADRADHAGAVELWPLAPLPDAAEPEPWTVPDAEPRPDLGAADPGGDAGAMDRARGRRRRDAGEQGPAARPRRRDGAGASQERLRPRAGARAEVAAACRWPGWTG